MHDLLVVFIEPKSLLLILDVLELNADRRAVNLVEVLLGLLDRADFVNQGLRYPIV